MKNLQTKVPADLKRALLTHPSVKEIWEDLTPIARRDFTTWIEGAKQEETRKRRIEITRSKLAKGDRRPCCYAVVPMNFYKALGGTPKAKATWSSLTPNERRDFVAWVEEPKEKEGRTQRIEKACFLLAKGKKLPHNTF